MLLSPSPRSDRFGARTTYITMDIADGEELHSAWYDMSERKKRWVVEQLKGYLGLEISN
jgi:hypothetical protein